MKSEHVVAETIVASAAQTVNPFIDDQKMENKYSLLEPEEKVHTYTLI